MIPVKLTIQGLYSYQEKQTIDFTRLTEANLFGIFGAVGSGKSSILEAITYAIYGETDRLNSRDNRNYNMMNLKSSDLLIGFIFETGKDQTAYQAVVKGRRNGKKFEEVKALERTAYRKENETWIPIEPEMLEKAIGLSYGNFKRTIIIPQGQFQEFLQLGNTDRTRMMKELFNLERFELYYKVTALESKNNANKQNIEGQLQQLGAIDQEQVNQFEEQLGGIKTEIAQLSLSLKENQTKDTEWKKLQELMKKFADSQQKLKHLQDRESEFIELEKLIRNYEQCLIQFKGLIDALDSSNKKIIQSGGQIEKETLILKKSEEEITSLEIAFAELKIAYDARDLLKQQAEELGKMARLNVLSASVLADDDRIRNGKIILDKTLETIEKLKSERGKLELLLKADKLRLPDLAMLSVVKTWHVDNINLHQQLAEKQLEIQKSQKEISAIEEMVKARFKDPVFAGLATEADITLGIQFLKDKIEILKKQIFVLDGETEHYRVQAKLEEYAVNLNDGEACPLCGSLSHPAVLTAENVAEALSKTLKNRGIIEKEIADTNENIGLLSDLSNRMKFNLEHLGGLSAKLKELDVKIARHAALFRWESYKDEVEVNQAFLVAESIHKIVKEKENELEKVMANLEKEASNEKKFQAEIEKIRMALTSAQTEIKTLSEQVQLLKFHDYRTKTSAEIETEKRELQQKQVSLEKQFNELTTRLNELRKTKDTINGSLEANRKALLLEQESNVGIHKQLSERLEQSTYSGIDQVKQILSQELKLELQKQKLTDFKHDLALQQSQVGQLQNEIANRTYDSEAHQKLLAEIGSTAEKLNLKISESGKVEQQLNKLRKDLESQAMLRKEFEALELRAENIKTMKALFKGSGFVNYISSVYLQNLCNAANDRFFQLTRQKLSLEITADNNFQVRDFLNGGKVRSVKTLSGGQTFQAALSLALALADNIQKITDSNQNFFFLDEGFGSLDKDSLAVVFDTLKSLRKENRIVGVISHVEEMQQEIDTHLRIENHEVIGSRIWRSWE